MLRSYCLSRHVPTGLGDLFDWWVLVEFERSMFIIAIYQYPGNIQASRMFGIRLRM